MRGNEIEGKRLRKERACRKKEIEGGEIEGDEIEGEGDLDLRPHLPPSPPTSWKEIEGERD